MNFIETARFGDTYLFAIDIALFWVGVALVVAFGIGIAYLAALPQPVPNRDAWHQETEGRRWAASRAYWARRRKP